MQVQLILTVAEYWHQTSSLDPASCRSHFNFLQANSLSHPMCLWITKTCLFDRYTRLLLPCHHFWGRRWRHLLILQTQHKTDSAIWGNIQVQPFHVRLLQVMKIIWSGGVDPDNIYGILECRESQKLYFCGIIITYHGSSYIFCVDETWGHPIAEFLLVDDWFVILRWMDDIVELSYWDSKL